ncbi:MAG: hypothetical protein GEU97_01915 [Actinophytocola sp.]|nr:hypothetical protein [Actinophytocola sp.]
MSNAVDEALQKVTELDAKIKELFDKVNSTLEWVPGLLEHLVQPIIDGMNWLAGEIRDFFAKLDEYINNPGNPFKLDDLAEAWRNDVGNKVGAIADTLTDDKLATDDEWYGSGAEAYKDVATQQSEVLNKVKTVSTTVADTLKEMANAIENFWIAFALMIVDLLVTVGLAIAEAAGVVSAPAVPPTVAAGLAVAIGLLSFAGSELKSFFDTMDTKQDTIEQQVTDLGKEWTRATPSASWKMGDTGQWQPA